jgi:hypothetical protein
VETSVDLQTGDTEEDLNRIWVLRKVLNPLSPVDAMELLTPSSSRRCRRWGSARFSARGSAFWVQGAGSLAK